MFSLFPVSNPVRSRRPIACPRLGPFIQTHFRHVFGIQVRRSDEGGGISPVYAAGARWRANAVLEVGFLGVDVVDVVSPSGASVAYGECPGAFQSIGRGDVVRDVGGTEESRCVGFAGVVVDAS